MAIVIKRGNTLHLQWYDPGIKKTNSKSLKMIATSSNMIKARKIAEEFQRELTSEYQKTIVNPFREKNIEEAFNHFLKINEYKNEKTKKHYKWFYKHFLENYESDEPVSVITKLSFEEWMLDLRNLEYQQNSIHGIAIQGLHFLNFLFEYDYIDVFRVNKNVKTRPEIKDVIVFEPEHLNQIFDGLKNKNDNFKFCVTLMYYTGLRSKDLLSIEKKDIDLNKRTLRYRNNKIKGGKYQYNTVPYHNNLHETLVVRKKKMEDGEHLVEYSNVESISRAMKRYFVFLEIADFNYTPRTFRKTFMTTLRNIEVDESVVQKLVGHTGKSVMDRHYNKVQLELLRRNLNKLPSPSISNE